MNSEAPHIGMGRTIKVSSNQQLITIDSLESCRNISGEPGEYRNVRECICRTHDGVEEPLRARDIEGASWDGISGHRILL
jgi:hypothetical protein